MPPFGGIWNMKIQAPLCGGIWNMKICICPIGGITHDLAPIRHSKYQNLLFSRGTAAGDNLHQIV